MAVLVWNARVYQHAVAGEESGRMPLELLERELFGFDHRDAARYLVDEWKLPSELSAVLFAARMGSDADLAYLIRDAEAEATALGLGLIDEPSTTAPDPMFFEIAERVNQIEQELGV